ncbi:22758_t:CDS:1, partial [Entrophospora sp. SA101]
LNRRFRCFDNSRLKSQIIFQQKWLMLKYEWPKESLMFYGESKLEELVSIYGN